MSSANQINFNKSIITQRYKLNTRRMLKDEAQISSFFFPLLKKKKKIIKIDVSRLFLFLPERIAPTFDRRWTLYRIKKIKQLKIKNFNFFFFFLNSIWQKSWTPKMIRSGGSPKGGGPRRTKKWLIIQSVSSHDCLIVSYSLCPVTWVNNKIVLQHKRRPLSSVDFIFKMSFV